MKYRVFLEKRAHRDPDEVSEPDQTQMRERLQRLKMDFSQIRTFES